MIDIAKQFKHLKSIEIATTEPPSIFWQNENVV